MVYLLVLVVLLVALFIATHVGPLSQAEVIQLGQKRRSKWLNQHFIFHNTELVADREIKKSMPANGGYWHLNEPLHRFPSVAAALLKGKKHEWIIIAFEKQGAVVLAWMNKGPHREGVSPFISVEGVASTARNCQAASILVLHNHPNINPSQYNCTRPSNADVSSAHEWSTYLNGTGLNSIEFVCERGMHYEYWRSYSDSFMPVSTFAQRISEANGNSKLTNLGLHFERVF
jgi:hypothetical protein